MNQLSITELCRKLRKEATPAEIKLWEVLNAREFNYYKFRRQQPFIYLSIQGEKQFFIADFYCAEKKLIIELDGKIHDFQKDYDSNRDRVLGLLGLKTFRIKNERLEQNFENVLIDILMVLEERNSISP